MRGTKRATSRLVSGCMQSVEAFLQSQILILQECRTEKGARDVEQRLAECLKLLRQKCDSKNPSKRMSKESDDTPSKTDFPYPMGVVAQAAIPALFRRELITDEDLEYLLSAEATKDFVCRKVAFLRPYVTGARSEREDKTGRDRYYTSPILVYKNCKYYFTKELENVCGKFSRLLKWIFRHGINREELLSLCAQVSAAKGKASPRVASRKRQHAAGRVESPGSATSRVARIGDYVKSFLKMLSLSGYEFSEEDLGKVLDPAWSSETLKLWRPFFVMKSSISDADRDAGRYWKNPYTFGSKTFYVFAQWYVKNGPAQKNAFDEWAVEMAKKAGIDFTPYDLPGIVSAAPVSAQHAKTPLSVVREKPDGDYIADNREGVTIRIGTVKAKTLRFKGH